MFMITLTIVPDSQTLNIDIQRLIQFSNNSTHNYDNFLTIFQVATNKVAMNLTRDSKPGRYFIIRISDYSYFSGYYPDNIRKISVFHCVKINRM